MTHNIDPESFGFLITDIARLLRMAVEREIGQAAIPVTPAEARVLAHIARCSGIRQHVLAERMGLSPMSVTGFLDRLERAGMIERGTDPDDRRAKVITLTAAGTALLDPIARAARRARITAFEGISEADQTAFRSIALHLRNNLANARQDATAERRSA